MSLRGKDKKSISESLETMKLLDENIISWLGWEYKTYIRKTGFNDGIFDEVDGKKRQEVLQIYSRPFPHAVPGVINFINYDDHTRNFTLTWTIPPYYDSEGDAIISTGRNWHYQKGMLITLNPNISSAYHEDGNFLHIRTAKRQYPQTIRLEIMPK